MQEEQRIKLHHIIQRLAEAQADVLEASETTLMSDAKSSVYRLHSDVAEDQSLDPGIKSKLMPFLEEALSGIIGSGSPYTRAQKSHEQLIKAEQYLNEQLKAKHATSIIVKIKNVLMTIGGSLVYVIIAVGIAILVALVFKGTPWIAENIYPWINTASGIALLIPVPICILLSIFKRTRGIGGAGLYISSYVVGINLWVWSLMVAYSLAGIVWLVVGVLLGGIGIVPIAIIAALFKTEWAVVGEIILLLVIVIVLRGFGVYLAGKAS